LKRGEVWTVSGTRTYAGKPRPSVIVQDDHFLTEESVTLVPLTSDPTEAQLVRITIVPDGANGLREESRAMADKVTTVTRAKLGKRIGVLAADDMRRIEQAVITFLRLGTGS
jgi:mRNA interferase MazF